MPPSMLGRALAHRPAPITEAMGGSQDISFLAAHVAGFPSEAGSSQGERQAEVRDEEHRYPEALPWKELKDVSLCLSYSPQGIKLVTRESVCPTAGETGEAGTG